jgi:hypothetical protein
MVTGNLHALLVVLELSLEPVGKVRRCAHSKTPLPLLGKGEADQLTLHLQPTHQL